jgi:hypothetical protein
MPRSTRSSSLGLVVLYSVLGLWCLGLLVFGAMHVQDTLGMGSVLAGVMGMIIVAATAPIAMGLRQLTGTPDMPQAPPSASTDRLLERIHDNTMLSDAAKRVLFRERELELLRSAIEEDISRNDFHAGLTLCDEMANLFGHREEAETFRARLLQAGHASYEAQVLQALSEFDHLLSQRDWAKAYEEAARIRRLYPESQLVHELDQRILNAREDHKRELESSFLKSADSNDVDQAMRLLKQLDRYLTRDEASRLSNVAQGVVVKHRDGLSAQFKLAVSEHRWADAAYVGDTIIAEYPNTKMADEVRSMIDVLRVRASQAAVLAGE